MLTVLIATHNRSHLLKSTLDNFKSLRSPTSGWKLIVIDNASTDGTREVVHGFRDSLPVTYRFLPKLGKNAALNFGITELEGDLAVFSDDDVAPRADWLLQLRAAADANPGYQLFGGVILPKWEVPPPDWIAYMPQAPLFSTTDERLQTGPTDAGNLFGPNLAIRSFLFARGVRFDESIGPRGKSYPMGSETELLMRLSHSGCKAWHVREAVVEHCIREYQMQRSWILRRGIRHGRGRFRLSRLHQHEVTPFATLALAIIPRMAKRVGRSGLAWISGNDRQLLTAQWEFSYNLGLLMEAFRMKSEKRAPISAALSTDSPHH